MVDARLAKVRARIQPRWDDAREERVRAAIDRRARLQKVRRAGLVAAAGLVALVALFFGRWGGRPDGTRGPIATTATPLDAASLLVVDPGSGGRGFTLERGGARFVVAHDEAHPFRVHARGLLVEDVGTIFTVRFVTDAIAEVDVEEGRVRVAATGRTYELGAGDRRTFDAPALAPAGTGNGSAAPAASAAEVPSADEPDETHAGDP